MRRFEFTDGTSNKFWEITVSGTQVTTHWGRIGTNGQSKTKALATAEKAQAEADKQIRSKVKKGYVEVGVTEPETADVAEPGEVASTTTSEPVLSSSGPVDRGELPDPIVSKEPVEAELPDETRCAFSSKVRALLPENWTGRAVRARTREEAVHQIRTYTERSWLDGLDRRVEALNLIQRWSAGADDIGGLIEIATIAHTYSRTKAQEKLAHAIVDLLIVEAGLLTAVRASLLSGGKRSWPVPTGPVIERLRWHLHQHPDRREELRDALAPLIDSPSDRKHPALTADGWLTTLRLDLVYLFPEREDWVDRAFRSFATGHAPNLHPRDALVFGQLATVVRDARDLKVLGDGGALRSGVWGVQVGALRIGPEVLPAVETCLDRGRGQLAVTDVRALYDLVASLPSEAAARWLVDRMDDPDVTTALRAFGGRFPVRATIALGRAHNDEKRPVLPLLRELTRTHPGALAKALETLGSTYASLIETLEPERRVHRVADMSELPEVLRDPPWRWSEERRPRAASVVAVELPERVTLSDETRLRWREEDDGRPGATPSGVLDRIRRGVTQVVSPDVLETLETADVASVSDRVTLYVPKRRWANPAADEQSLRRLLVQHGYAVVPIFLASFPDAPDNLGPLLRYASSRTLVEHMLGYHSGRKAVRPEARAWLLAYPLETALVALEWALTGRGRRRTHAEAALELLASQGATETIAAAAEALGVRTEAEAYVHPDPLTRFPLKPSKSAVHVPIAELEAPRLIDREAVLPQDAVEVLVEMLAMSPLDDPYVGLAIVKSVCTPASLERFAWGIFEHWKFNMFPTKTSWMLSALGHLGGDDAAIRLASYIRKWPGERAHKRAVDGLDVLLAIGTDAALMELNGIAQKVKFKGIKKNAQQRIQALAEARGLSTEALADRLVPDLGLDAQGTMVLDFGSRRFRVGFDETLKPYVRDDAGKRRASLPKPGKKDDAELAQQATDRWKLLKKQVRSLSKLQILRLEQAMIAERRWTPSEFRRLFVEHPLVFHIAYRLIWGVFDAKGSLTQVFRVADDHTLVDPDEAEVVLEDEARIGIVHPLQVADDRLDVWGEVFADYEILQPFAQLGREIHPFPAELVGRDIYTPTLGELDERRVRGLVSRGWEMGEAWDHGYVFTFYRRLPDGRLLCFDFEPGIPMGYSDDEAQRLDGVYVSDDPEVHQPTRFPLGEMGAVAWSEMMRDVAYLAADG